MSYLSKNGQPFFIGRNVKMTPVKSYLIEKRNAFLNTATGSNPLDDVDSEGFLQAASDDPVAFTYSLWNLFSDDAARATNKLCDLTENGGGRDVIRALEIMLTDAPAKINALCLGYIVSQISGFIDTNPGRVRKAFEKILFADFPATVRVMKKMYETSPRMTKEIGKKLVGYRKFKFLKMLMGMLPNTI